MKATLQRKLGWLALIVLLLVIVRVALPYAVRGYLNDRMDRMGDYHGQIRDIDLAIWRGAYSIDGLQIVKLTGRVPVPLVEARLTEISLSWRALSHGVLRGKLDFTDATVNFVDGGNQGDSQTGKGVDWREKLKLLAPIRLEELRVRNGTVTFRNFVSSPRVDLKMTEVNGTVTNLTNVDRRGGARVAQLDVTAKILGDAPLRAKASFDPLERQGDFNYQLSVSGIKLVRANDLARAYAGLDFAGGEGDFTMELQASNGRLDGYAKPIFRDLKIFSWKQDAQKVKKNPLKLAWEALAQGVTSVLKNPSNGQFATRVPISGRIDDKQLDAFSAIVGILRNAFVKAYTPQLENLKPRSSASDTS
ncbi:MAG: DUF748 domain-containing protein [Dyella sp.]